MSKVDWSVAPWANLFAQGQFFKIENGKAYVKSVSGDFNESYLTLPEILSDKYAQWNRLHWYCFIFSFNGGQVESYVGLLNKDAITKKVVNSAREMTGVDERLILSNAVYLGYMTKEEFANE